MKKNILFLIALLVSVSFICCNVNALTSSDVTLSDSITLPERLYSDSDFVFTISDNVASPTSSYQLVPVTDSTITAKIDAIIVTLNEINLLESNKSLTTTTEEFAQFETAINDAKALLPSQKAELFSALTNNEKYGDSWISTTNSIPSSIVTNDSYYIVWIKAVSGETELYQFGGYKAITSSTANPDTGLFDTALYIGVGILIIVGAYLVINKNKERYE